MIMKKIISLLIFLLVVGSIVVFSGCVSHPQLNNTPVVLPTQVKSQTPSGSLVDTDNDGIPDSAEKVLGTDPINPDTDGDGINDKQDPHPTKVDIQFKPSTGPKGFAIKEVVVENNYDSVTKKAASDHLEIILENPGSSDISNFSVYYKITDLNTTQEESYIKSNSLEESYRKSFEGFTLKAHETKSMHIDSGQNPGHFRANPNSMYYILKDAMQFNVTVSAEGYQAQTASVEKAAGGAEVAD